MGTLGNLFLMTLAEAGLLFYLKLSYHFDTAWMARWTLWTIPVNAALLWGMDLVAVQTGLIYFRRGGRAARGYSELRTQAFRGEREAACKRLARIFRWNADPKALATLIDIASDSPPLKLWLAKAAVMSSSRRLSPEDRAFLKTSLKRATRAAIQAGDSYLFS